MGKIEYKTLNDRAYDSIKTSLINSEFIPKQVLVIRTLAESYGISATPVREALQRLVGEGQLLMLSNRSIAVPDWDAEKFLELFKIRCELEGLASEMATPLLSKATISKLEKLALQIGKATDGRDYKGYVSLNQKFHFTIYESANSPRLLRIIENLWGEVGVYMNELFSNQGYSDVANNEHLLIIEEIRNRNPAAVRHHMVMDITTAADHLLPRIRELATPTEETTRVS